MTHTTRRILTATAIVAAASTAGAFAQEKDLPAGHPMLSTKTPAMDVIPEVDSDAGTGEAALTWRAPTGWIAEPPANNMRRAQYRITGEKGDAECLVYYFGAGQGGEPEANAQRWANQFVQRDGSPSAQALIMEHMEVNGVQVLAVEITGDYSTGAMGDNTGGLQADFMLLGAVAEGPDSNWFFKLTGPRPTVEEERQAFRELISSIRAGQDP